MIFAWSFSLAVCFCCCSICFCLRRLAYHLLSGYDLDSDGKLSCRELTYVLDEFIGDLCFTCTCPTVHDKEVTRLAGVVTVLEAITNTPVFGMAFWLIASLWLIVMYMLELLACLDCWDLAAAAHHEVGHLLSLDHPEKAVNTAITIVKLLHNATTPDSAAPPAPPPPPPPPPLDASAEARTSPWCSAAAAELAQTLSVRHANHPAGTAVEEKQMDSATRTSLSESVMREFDIFSGSAPHGPGKARRCLSQDDLDGLNFLYPPCVRRAFYGFDSPPPCEGDEEDWPITGQRLMMNTIYLASFAVLSLFAIKLFAMCFLSVEDRLAQWYVRGNAVLMLRHGASSLTLRGQSAVQSVLFRKRNQRLLQIRMAVRLQAAVRRMKARTQTNSLLTQRLQAAQTKALAAARLQAVVRGRADRAAVGLPGSKKARMYAMRRQIEALNAQQQALMLPPNARPAAGVRKSDRTAGTGAPRAQGTAWCTPAACRTAARVAPAQRLPAVLDPAVHDPVEPVERVWPEPRLAL
jgi:hypothetical protein